jgi:TolB protein
MNHLNRLSGLVFGLSVACATLPAAGGEPSGDRKDEKPKWSVESPSGTPTPVAIDTTQGTWMNLDVSPDGKEIAFDLLGDIFVMPIAGGEARQLTDTVAWDMQPRYSPDGKRIAFTSDRGGGPQVYEVDAEGKGTRRLSFEGDWNARPVVAPDGRSIALITREDGQFRVGVMDARGALRVLTDGRLDESPSFAPNSSIILYATEHKGRGVLAAVSTDGRVRQRLALAEGDVREPAWSPYPPARD